MKKFDANAALNQLDNKNNKKTKRNSIIVCAIVLVFAILYFSFARFESNQTFSLIRGTINIPKISLIDQMINLTNAGASDLEYDGTQVLGEYGTPDNNLRYIGSSPNNYIYYNCNTDNPEEMSSSTCELWRIVGLFNNIEDENGVEKNRVKIMRHYGFSNVSWDTNVSTINAGYGINQWGESTYKDGTPYEGADLMRELNTDYLGNTTVGTDGKWYGGRNNSKSGRMYDSLSQTSIDMIQTVKWYTGPSIIDTGYPSSSVMYSNERGPFELASSSSSQGNDTVERTGTWIGKVALINTTDYIYSTSGSSYDEKIICLSDGIYNFFEGDHRCTVYTWMYNSTTMVFLNAYSNKYYKSFVMSTVHSGRSDTEASEPSFLYKPALFLKDEVKIADGDGSESNPYKLVLNE